MDREREREIGKRIAEGNRDRIHEDHRVLSEIDKMPETTPKPCSDCPWRRNAAKGWLGPMTPEEWLEAAHSDTAIACHQTIRDTDETGHGDWEHPQLRQCRGAASFRGNVCKSPRDPRVEAGPVDRENVFSNNQEFLDHHKPMHDEFYERNKEKD